MTSRRLIVAGIPLALFQRIKSAPFELDGWETRLIPSQEHSRAALSKGVFDQIVAWATHSRPGPASQPLDTGGHVLAFSVERDRDKWRCALQTYLRFRWLDNGALSYLPYDLKAFRDIVAAEAKF